MSWASIINNLNFDSIPIQILYDHVGHQIEARYVGNYTDPETQQSYFVYATNDRTPVYVPQPLAPHQQPIPEYPADPRQDSPRQESARQRRLTRRAARREAMQQFRESQVQRNLFANPGNIFMNPEPMEPMHRPASPVRQQAPDPRSRRSRRKASRQQRDERAASGRIYGGAKTKRRRH